MLLGGDQHLATEVAALLLRRELVLPVRAGDTRGDHGLLQFVDVERAAEAGLAVGDDRGQPVLDRAVALDLGDLVGAQQCVVDAADHLRHRVGRVQALVGVGVAGQVRVTGDLPTRQVDGLQAGTDLLDGLVAGQRAERVDEVHVVQLRPRAPRRRGGRACSPRRRVPAARRRPRRCTCARCPSSGGWCSSRAGSARGTSACQRWTSGLLCDCGSPWRQLDCC